MAFETEQQIRKDSVREVAHKMMVAARTAPKGKGVDNIEIAFVDGVDIQKIATRMKKIGEQCGMKAFPRDAENILKSDGMVLMGTRFAPIRLAKCGLCGYANCEAKEQHPEHPCAFNTGDLGIAVGSAVSIAMDNRIDNRVMYTVGIAALELGTLGPDVKIVYGIPLSVNSKNIFFDRK